MNIITHADIQDFFAKLEDAGIQTSELPALSARYTLTLIDKDQRIIVKPFEAPYYNASDNDAMDGSAALKEAVNEYYTDVIGCVMHDEQVIDNFFHDDPTLMQLIIPGTKIRYKEDITTPRWTYMGTDVTVFLDRRGPTPKVRKSYAALLLKQTAVKIENRRTDVAQAMMLAQRQSDAFTNSLTPPPAYTHV